MARQMVTEVDNYIPDSARVILTTTIASVLAAAANGGRIIIDKIVVQEYSAASRTFTLRHVKSGGDETAASNNIYYDEALNSKESFPIDGPIVLEAGDALWGLASANTAVSLSLHYRTERV